MKSNPKKITPSKTYLIESDDFDFEFLSEIGKQESWRKEIHRPIYHIHKWWAKRLGSVFRGILLGTVLPPSSKLSESFYDVGDYSSLKVFDPFMGSGTTIGEAHKLGFSAIGKDINPVAVEAVRIALGPLDKDALVKAFTILENGVGKQIKSLYSSLDSNGKPCDVLYFFWVMQTACLECKKTVDLFPSWVIARNAYPDRKPEVRILCPKCGNIFSGTNKQTEVECTNCNFEFNPEEGVSKGAKALCNHCHSTFSIIDSLESKSTRPDFRLYGKLVLTSEGKKEYLPTTKADINTFNKCSDELKKELTKGKILLPTTQLMDGNNTKQAMKYGFKEWRDFFNDRQLLSLGLLQSAIQDLDNEHVRDVFLTLFSGMLEFNNLFASYKGEGTGAVRHMFSHHILKPEKMPIEANIWGTSKSSGSFSGMFRNRILRAIAYRENPIEISEKDTIRPTQKSFSGKVKTNAKKNDPIEPGAIYLACGDSSKTDLADQSIDFVVTDPPFFDNVHYSELADFFYAWQQLIPRGFIGKATTTRSDAEVQDADASDFARKLEDVFRESNRVLKDDGLMIFSYHHSRDEGWKSVAEAILNAGFIVVNAHPVRAEMSGGTPKNQAKSPIQLDAILICRKTASASTAISPGEARNIANKKIERLKKIGLDLSSNDEKVVVNSQMLTTLRSAKEFNGSDLFNGHIKLGNAKSGSALVLK